MPSEVDIVGSLYPTERNYVTVCRRIHIVLSSVHLPKSRLPNGVDYTLKIADSLGVPGREPNRRRTNIQGPHSALTDFLAANNISAAEIRATYEARRRQLERNEAINPSGSATPVTGENVANSGSPEAENHAGPIGVSSSRRRAEVTAAIKRKRQMRNFGISDDESPYGTASNLCPGIPGQFVNCDSCGSRFVVNTLTSRSHKGTVLCTVCSGVDRKIARSPRQTRQGSERLKRCRRQYASNLMDGAGPHGTLSLLDVCVKHVADNIYNIEEFGDIPPRLRLKLSQILSKRRAINSRTLRLFTRSDCSSLDIYDCADLDPPDFRNIFISLPNIRHLNLRFAGQLKNDDLDLLITLKPQLEELQLDACNLVSTETFQRLFNSLGSNLISLKLSNLDCSLDDDTMRDLTTCCPNIQRLKLSDCWLLGDGSLQAVGNFQALRHLSLSLEKPAKASTLISTLTKIGAGLESLSLKGFGNADDRVLETVRQKCTKLVKFRFTDNSVCSDKGFTSTFNGWRNCPLRFVDFSRTRDIDNTNPDGPGEAVGLASEGFKSLMRHSGGQIERLHISACRHISYSAFLEVFNSLKKYPHLKELDISFHTVIDDVLLQKIFSSCPALVKVVAFACFNVRDAAIPAGVSYFGGLNAHKYVLESGTGPAF
ncbi:hypothetical protein KEM54_001497 [Ascosphaera aggregata]|nr:hypothetical protein KEM54_001497 [Ascosphaera aggregata]